MIATSRNTDPITSYVAAENHKENAITNRQKCLMTLIEFPKSTSAEVAHYSDLDRYEGSRRLPELRRMGMVKNGEARKCTIRGTMQMTWEVI
jgi:CRP-like cAMP-binding protein